MKLISMFMLLLSMSACASIQWENDPDECEKDETRTAKCVFRFTGNYKNQ